MNNQIKYSLQLLKDIIDENNINLNKKIDAINDENNLILSSLSSRIDNLELTFSKIDKNDEYYQNDNSLKKCNLLELNNKIEKLENDINMINVKKNVKMDILNP